MASPFLASLLDHIRNNIGSNESSGFVALAVLFFLGLGAVQDARSGRIPDLYLLCGAVIAVAARAVEDGLIEALGAAGLASLLWGALWGLNELYYKWRKQDGFGMGDAKWLALTVLAFGFRPALAALFIGSWLALAALALTRHRKFAVRFGPFLFFGLLIGLAVV